MEIKTLDLNVLEDNQALQALVRETVISGPLAYVYERAGDYRKFAELQGQRYEVFGAWQNHQLLGATQVTFDHVYWNGQKLEVSYSGDTRIHLAARGQRVADRLIESACRRPMPVVGAVLQSNRVILDRKLADWSKVGVDFKIFGDLKVFLYRTTSSDFKWGVRFASEADLPEMFELWSREAPKKNLARAYNDLTEFKASYLKAGGISLDQTLVCCSADQKLIGMLSVWNQSTVRTLRVQSRSFLVKVVSMALNPWIQLPSENTEMKISYGSQWCIDSTHSLKFEVLTELVTAGRSLAKKQGSIFFSMGLDSKDSFYAATKKNSLVENTVKIIVANAEPDGRPFHLEVGLG